MRSLDTSAIATYTIEASGQMIGDQAVLVPKIQNDKMRQILAIFQGLASIGSPRTTVAGDTGTGDTGALGIVQSIKFMNPAAPTAITTTTIPQIEAPVQNSIGIVPPVDPTCH